MKPRGVAKLRLSIVGLTSLIPTDVDVLICDKLGPDFLVGRKALAKWELSVHYRGKQKTWQAGDQQVSAMSQRGAEEYNGGFISEWRLCPDEWARTREVFNNNRTGTCFGWTTVSRGNKGGKLKPPLWKNRPPLRRNARPWGSSSNPSNPNVCRRSEKPTAPPWPDPSPPVQVNPLRPRRRVPLCPPIQVNSLLLGQGFHPTRLCGYHRSQVTPTGASCSGLPPPSFFPPVQSARFR